MRVTFDTNVLISATLWDKSAAQKLLFKLISKDVKIFSSGKIIAEYQKVLARDFDYKNEETAKIMEKIAVFINLVEPEEKIDIIKEDPEDNMILECALSSSSEYIATYDKHLLKINNFKGIKILKPEELINLF
jgi:hypothetical protein